MTAKGSFIHCFYWKAMHLFVKFNISILILHLLINGTIAQNEVSETRDGKGCVFKYFNITRRYHNNAQKDCKLWGGTLVIPNSQDVMDLLKELIVNTTGIDNAKELHVGGEKHNDGKFYWSTGDEITANGYSGWPSWGGYKLNPYMGIRYLNENIFWKSTSSTRYFMCQKEDQSSVHRTCTGYYSFMQTAEYCRGKCYCPETRYGNNCEFVKPVIESCHILPTSIDPLFPLNITCIITGYTVNDQTSVQWEADGNILDNNTDDTVFYRKDMSVNKAIVTLVVKRAICLGSLQIKLVVTQSYNAKPLTPNVKEILLNSSFNTIKDIKLDSPQCNGTISSVQWNSNAPNYIQKNIYYYITTVPQTEAINTSATNCTLTKLSPETLYDVQITAHISDDATCSKQKESRHANATIVTGFGKPFYVTNLNVTNIGGLACQVLWDFDYLENVNNYTILIIGETIHARTNVTFPTFRGEVTITSGNKTTYWLRIMPPNKKYSFEVFASSCDGNGASVSALNSCSTPIKAPSIISKPDLSSSYIDNNGTIKITVKPVNEENGLVSCLLVVVTTKTLQSNNTLMTQDQFTEMTNTIGYIAYCIKNVSSTNHVTLGRNEVTYCENDEHSGNMRRSMRNYTFIGNNTALNEADAYWVYVISVSDDDADDKLLYRRSIGISAEKVSTTTTQTTTKSGVTFSHINGTGTAVVVTLVLFVIIVAVLVIIWKVRSSDRFSSYLSVFKRENRQDKLTASVAYENVAKTTENETPAETTTIFEQEPTYANFEAEDPSFMSLETLQMVFNENVKTDSASLDKAFWNLVSAYTIDLPHSMAQDPRNKSKNRFKNIFSYDQSQVTLRSEGNNYINASYIDGYESPKKFIATQGPLESTVEDFWQLIFEQNVSVIVMLTNCVEGTKNKCYKYWPNVSFSLYLESRKIVVTAETSQILGGYTKRTFVLVSEQKAHQRVTQFHMTTWPDHGIPMITSTVLTLYKHVVELASLNDKAPIVVHCSAGAGRTGTFIGLDICHNQMQYEERVSFEQCITTMRQNRVQMIQTPDQYTFLQKLVIEISQLSNDLTRIEDFDVVSQTDEFQLDLRRKFEITLQMIPLHNSTESSKKEFPASERVPYDSNRMFLIIDTKRFLYNASYIFDYYGKKNLMIAEHPNQNNCDLYWNMIEMKDVKIIVCLDDIDMDFIKKQRPVSIVQEKVYQIFRFGRNVGSASENKQSQDKFIIFGKMDSNRIEKVMFQMISSLQDISNKNGTICVQSRSNPELPGIFCASLNGIEQAKIEHEIDVIQAVKDVNDMRPNAISSIESVHIVVKVVGEYSKKIAKI